MDTLAPDSSKCYVASLYFVMTSLTSVGFGNISANTKEEQIFCVFVLLFGALVYATIFGNITTIIQQLHTDTNRYHDAINSVSEFSRQFHVPQELRDRIRDHIVSSWTIRYEKSNWNRRKYISKIMEIIKIKHEKMKQKNNEMKK